MNRTKTTDKHKGFVQIPAILMIAVSVLIISLGAGLALRSNKENNTSLVGNVSSTTEEAKKTPNGELGSGGLEKQENNDGDSISSKNNSTDESVKTISPQTNQQEKTEVSELEEELLGLKLELEKIKLQQENQKIADNKENVSAVPIVVSNSAPIPQIFSVSAATAYRSAVMGWETDIPTESKVFIIGNGFSNKVFKSETGLSTHHTAEITGLTPGRIYSYEVEAITQAGQVAKTGATFNTRDSKFSVERDTPSGIWIFKSEGERFIIEAITLLADKSLDGIITTSSSGVDFDYQQRISFRTCDSLRSLFQEFSGTLYPYPCPAFMFSYSISRQDHWGNVSYNLVVNEVSKLRVSGDFMVDKRIEMFFLKARGELTQEAVCFAKALPIEATAGTKDCGPMVLLP